MEWEKVLAGECHSQSVWTETGGYLVALVRGEARCRASGNRHGIEVAAVAEHYFRTVSGGEAEQACLVGRRPGCAEEQHGRAGRRDYTS